MIAALEMPVPAYYAETSRAAGQDAQAVEARLREVTNQLNASETVSANRRAATQRLREALEDAELEDAEATSTAHASIRYAQSFLNVLPDHVQPPEVDFANDGEVTFEWIASRRARLMVSFSKTGELNYAALYPAGVSKGREYFAGGLPQTIAVALVRVLG